VEFPLVLLGVAARECRARADRLLERVNIAHWRRPCPPVLGVGRCRGVPSRAPSCMRPVILADEPTGNLDSVNSANILDLTRN
jgi:putative ABC transport system ATP-binding protein